MYRTGSALDSLRHFAFSPLAVQWPGVSCSACGRCPSTTCGCSADAGGPPILAFRDRLGLRAVQGGGGSPVRTPQFATRSVAVIAVPLLLAAAAAVAAPVTAAAATARTGPADPASSVTISGSLSGVAATSARNAWAVGFVGGGTLILHWNGSAWRRVSSPSPAGSTLRGVAATSARNAWAVGCANCTSGAPRTLILHWNGSTWSRVPSPAGQLSGVAVVSARDAWAVGYAGTSPAGSLILHWNGSTWSRVPSPGGYLSGVAATSARSAWAVGEGTSFSSPKTLILRWNGTSWKRAPSPSVGAHFIPFLNGVAATSARSAWAVGDSTDCGCGPGLSLILRWNGTSWKKVPSPTPGGGTTLFGVAAVSARRAWAVGLTGEGTSLTKTLILRWNGTTWKKVPAPAPRASSGLSGVAATSAGRAWAVGFTTNRSRAGSRTLILRWNGRAWK